MSITVTGTVATLPARRSPVLPGLAAPVRRWLRGRRQAALEAVVEARLCEDAGLPMPAPRPIAPRLLIMGGG